MAAVRRVATIDIGTNTVLLLVAERGDGGALRAVEEAATITRLGEGVDRTRRLAPAAIERTTACLSTYAGRVRALDVGEIAVVGTSAMRDAAGGEEVRRAVRDLLGVEARVVSGAEEARLAFRGAMSGLAVPAGGRVAVFDIGGGSTEIVLGEWRETPDVTWSESIDIGSVRLTERHAEDHAAIAQAAREALAGVPGLGHGVIPVGIAGTMTTLAAVALGIVPYDGAKVHGCELSRAMLEDVVHRLAAMDVESRRRVPGMEPKRADVIVAGGWIALALVEHWSAPAVRVSDRGVRWGLAEELLAPRPT